MSRSHSRAALIALVALLPFAACGDDTPEASPSPTEPPALADGSADGDDQSGTDTSVESDPGSDDQGRDGPVFAGGACSLLDADFLAATVAFEFGESVWEEQPDPRDPDRCRWFNESKLLTLTVQVTDAATADLDGRRDDPPSTGSVELVDVAPGAFALRDDFGDRLYQLWIPLEGGLVASLVADVMQIDDASFLAVGAEVARRGRL